MPKLWERMKSWMVDKRFNPAAVRLKAKFPSYSSATLKNIVYAHFDQDAGSLQGVKFDLELTRAEARSEAKLRELNAIEDHAKAWPNHTLYLNYCLQRLDSAFPLMQRPFLRRKLESKLVREQGIWAVFEYFLAKDYPKGQLRKPLGPEELFRSPNYVTACTNNLLGEFPQLWQSEIQSVIVENNACYTKCHRELKQMNENRKAGWLDWLPTIGRPDNKRKYFPELEADMQQLQIAKDKQLALTSNEEEYEKEGQLIECECCYGDWPFEQLYQCTEGHLFCAACVEKMVGGLVAENSMKELVCFSCSAGDECGASISAETIRAALVEAAEAKGEAGGNSGGAKGRSHSSSSPSGGGGAGTEPNPDDDRCVELSLIKMSLITMLPWLLLIHFVDRTPTNPQLFDAYWRLAQQRDLCGVGGAKRTGGGPSLGIELARCPFCDQQQLKPPAPRERLRSALQILQTVRLTARILLMYGLPACLLLLPFLNLLRTLVGKAPYQGLSLYDCLRSIAIAAGISASADFFTRQYVASLNPLPLALFLFSPPSNSPLHPPHTTTVPSFLFTPTSSPLFCSSPASRSFVFVLFRSSASHSGSSSSSAIPITTSATPCAAPTPTASSSPARSATPKRTQALVWREFHSSAIWTPSVDMLKGIWQWPSSDGEHCSVDHCREWIAARTNNSAARAFVSPLFLCLLRCPSCFRQFHKSDGCNKMTCPCGAKMCYICRASVEDYSHFCGHFRAAGGACTQCKKCDLWASADDSRHIIAAGRASKERFLQRHPALRAKAAGVSKYGPYDLHQHQPQP
jgi:hypothetical protein